MNGFYLRLLLILGAITTLICGTVYLFIRKRLGLTAKANRGVLIFLIVTTILIITGPLLSRSGVGDLKSPEMRTMQFTQYFLMGWAGMNFMLLIMLEAVQFFVHPFDKTKRVFLTQGISRGIITGTTIASLGGLAQAAVGPSVIEVPIKIPTLPKSFDGLRIAQISDVHIGPLLQQAFLNRLVDQVMSLNADLIFITGDLVDGTVAQLKEQMEPLRRLQARDGVYFCTGNHEFYSGAQEWMDFLRSMNIIVLENSNRILQRTTPDAKTEAIAIAGVHDWHGDQLSGRYKSDCFAAARTESPVACKILLAHNPFSIDDAEKAGFDLQVSGHTHAGQFYPFVFLVKLKLKHVEGLYRINEKTQLYVNRGTGYWGPPNRLGKPSEVTHFTIRS